MDCNTIRYYYDTPINKYEVKCNSCKFPDINKIPEPYFMRKKFAYSNLEIFKANLGNLFLSDRIKKIFSVVFNEQLEYKPVYIENSTIKSKWWLGIIKNHVVSGEIKDEIPKCDKCFEPLHWHPGSQSKYWLSELESCFDIVKSKNWHSIDNKDWKISWITRDIFFSKRLIVLLKKLKAKGINETFKTIKQKATIEDKEWVRTVFEMLSEDLQFPNVTIYEESKKKEIVKKITGTAILTKNKNQNTTIKIKFENEIIELFKQLDKPLKLSNDTDFFIMKFEDWERNSDIENKRMNYINFASDSYGNYYSLDGNNKNYPVFYYNHETMAFEQIYNSIYEFIEVMV